MINHPPGVLLEIAYKDGVLFSNSLKGDICIRGNTSNQSMHIGSTTDLPPAFTISGDRMIVNAILGVGDGEPVGAFNVQSGDAYFSSNVYIENRLGLGTISPSEAVDIQNGNVKMNSNLIVFRGISVGKGANYPTESLDIGSNLKVASNAYVMNNLAIGSSNPIEAFTLQNGNAYIGSNSYVMQRLAVGGSSNPKETLDVASNAIIRSNAYILSRMTVGSTNSNTPTEALDIYGNTKVNSSLYVLNNISVGTSNPTERLDVTNNAKFRNNVYILGSTSIGATTSNPTEALDVRGNLKVSSNLYTLCNVVIGGSSNPSERLDVTGNAKISSNMIVMNRIGVAITNPTEQIEVSSNILARSNLYAMRSIGAGTILPRECIDATGNIRAMSNVYAINRLAVGHSNPTEQVDITQNIKVRTNAYVMSRLGVGTSNPVLPFHVIGNARIEGNLEVYGEINAAGGTVGGGGSQTIVEGEYSSNTSTWASNNLLNKSGGDISGGLTVSGGIATGRIIVTRANSSFTLNSNLDSDSSGGGVVGVDTWSSNVAVAASNTAFWTSNVAVAASNTALWTSNLAVTVSNAFWASNSLINNEGGSLDVSGYISADKILLPTSNALIGAGWDYSNNEWIPLASNGGFVLRNSTEGGMHTFTGTSNDGLQFSMAITSNGYCGLGTSNPVERLEVSGNIKTTSNVLAWSSSTTAPMIISASEQNSWFGMQAQQDNGLALGYSSNDAILPQMFLTKSGSVGIGESLTSPDEKLHIDGKVYSHSQHLGSSNSSASIPCFSWKANSNTGLFLASNNVLAFSTDGTERMTISETGYVGMGIAPTYSLHVSGTICATQDVLIYSDLRAKSNLEVIVNPLEKLTALTGYTYDFKTSTETPAKTTTKISDRFTGIIAQDLEKVLPEAVHKDENGNLSVAYGNLAGLFVESIKQIIKSNEELTKLNQMLNARVTALEQTNENRKN